MGNQVLGGRPGTLDTSRTAAGPPFGTVAAQTKPQMSGAPRVVPRPAFPCFLLSLLYSEPTELWSCAVTPRPIDVPEQGARRDAGVPPGRGGSSETSGSKGISAGSGLKMRPRICVAFAGTPYQACVTLASTF